MKSSYHLCQISDIEKQYKLDLSCFSSLFSTDPTVYSFMNLLLVHLTMISSSSLTSVSLYISTS